MRGGRSFSIRLIFFFKCVQIKIKEKVFSETDERHINDDQKIGYWGEKSYKQTNDGENVLLF